MFKKFKAFLMMILALLCLTSIGFASWITSNDLVQKSVNSQILVDDVVTNKNNGCIFLKDNTINSFEYGEKGFIDNKSLFVKKGNINADYIVNLALCKQTFSEFNSLKIKIVLSYNKQLVSYNLFESIEQKLTFTSSVNYQNNPISNYTTNLITDINDYRYEISLNLIDVLKNYDEGVASSELIIQYEWLIEDTLYFKSYVFPDLYDIDNNKSNLEFSINAIIEGM